MDREAVHDCNDDFSCFLAVVVNIIHLWNSVRSGVDEGWETDVWLDMFPPQIDAVFTQNKARNILDPWWFQHQVFQNSPDRR